LRGFFFAVRLETIFFPFLVMTPILYVKTGCPWCSAAEAVLDRNGISYDPIDVLRDRAAFHRMKEISGQTKAPTLEWDDRVLADFAPEDLEAFIKENNLK